MCIMDSINIEESDSSDAPLSCLFFFPSSSSFFCLQQQQGKVVSDEGSVILCSIPNPIRTEILSASS